MFHIRRNKFTEYLAPKQNEGIVTVWGCLIIIYFSFPKGNQEWSTVSLWLSPPLVVAGLLCPTHTPSAFPVHCRTCSKYLCFLAWGFLSPMLARQKCWGVGSFKSNSYSIMNKTWKRNTATSSRSRWGKTWVHSTLQPDGSGAWSPLPAAVPCLPKLSIGFPSFPASLPFQCFPWVLPK